MAMKSLDDLFTHFLKDMYYAERQILKALPGMSRKANSQQLRDALDHHREETEQQIQNLEKIFELIGARARGTTCPAMDGIIEEAKDIMSEAEDPRTRDAGMIGAAQAVEHYEITRYGTMIAWAKQLGMKDAVKLLQENLEQEKMADEKLTKLAEGIVNQKAAA
ncbi:MAG: ferritin-like domain-containing protein [Hyphomicrobiaceae bacterium]|nr:ferritin-like domain-containing protein [Hyphomicrobiaceae bacterium]